MFVYPFDAITSHLGEPLPSLTTAPGTGPRHITLPPDEKHIYVLNESYLPAIHKVRQLGALQRANPASHLGGKGESLIV